MKFAFGEGNLLNANEITNVMKSDMRRMAVRRNAQVMSTSSVMMTSSVMLCLSAQCVSRPSEGTLLRMVSTIS